MANFTPRLTAPSQTDLHWIKTTHGGYNRCIEIDEDTGSVLPNCTGYAWGRFLEENNLTDCNLSRANAEVWYSNIIDGYSRGQTAKLGAVICWESSQSGGHVAIVEEIKSNGNIVTSNSAYDGTRFYTQTLSPPNYNIGSAYTFQGFIYSPNDFGEEKSKKRFPWVLYANKLRSKKY